MAQVRVVPAILTDDATALEKMVRQTESFTDYAQIDVMDGQFVPSHSISWQHLAELHVRLSWEAHLMVLHPEEQLAGFRGAGARKVVFHYEATPTPAEVIARARELGLEVGLAVNPETPVSAIMPLAGSVDSVLFLSVNPGFYGSPFIPGVMDKIAEFHRARPGVETGIDGGIKEDNIASIAASGVDVIFIGSAIFRQPQPGKSFRRLLSLAEDGARQGAGKR